MIKEYNEITVRVTESFDSLAHRLTGLGYTQVRKARLLDRYYLPEDYDAALPTQEILNQAVLIREISSPGGSHVKLSRKYKEIDANGDILRQSNIDVEIGGASAPGSTDERTGSAAAFLEAIGYRWVFDIEDDLTVYEKDGLGICVQQVSGDRYLFIEIEENDRYQGIPQLISKLDETGIAYDRSSYFCKKAQIIYDEMYR
jgi:hypothetical protein